MISKIPLYFISFSKRSKVWISKMILSFAINHDFKLFSDILNGVTICLSSFKGGFGTHIIVYYHSSLSFDENPK